MRMRVCVGGPTHVHLSILADVSVQILLFWKLVTCLQVPQPYCKINSDKAKSPTPNHHRPNSYMWEVSKGVGVGGVGGNLPFFLLFFLFFFADLFSFLLFALLFPRKGSNSYKLMSNGNLSSTLSTPSPFEAARHTRPPFSSTEM